MCLYETLTVYPSELDARIAYFQRLDRHIHCVNEAFERYGKAFADALEFDLKILGENIARHDQSKKTNGEEIFGYLAEFYPYKGDNMPTSSYGLRRSAYEKGIMKHYHANKHHPEYWMSIDHIHNKIVTAPMEDPYIAEMVLDWIGHEDDGKLDVIGFWNEKGKKKFIHETTIPKIETLIGIVEADRA